ncbi:MAG: hypothetical protein AB8B99_22490 [Phormidesmis sp.]
MKKANNACSSNVSSHSDLRSHKKASSQQIGSHQIGSQQIDSQQIGSQQIGSQQTIASFPSLRAPSLLRPLSKLTVALLIMTGGLSFGVRSATAQLTPEGSDIAPDINFDSNTGSVSIDRNAFEIETGDFSNSSGIPLPATLTDETTEGVALPTRPEVLAPNSLEFGIDTDYINNAFNDALSEAGRSRFQIRPETVRFNKEFSINHSVGNHTFGEGIEVTVRDASGQIISQERAFVRGDIVQIGPDGETLPDSARITVEYGEQDTVELKVLNLREDNADPDESAIYFDSNGNFIVEDLPNGGDRDFNDGDYVEQPEGEGEAIASAALSDVTFETTTNETPLDPLLRTEEIVEQDIVQLLVEADAMVQEERDWGRVELPESNATRLGHARGALSEAGELLIYDRYAANNQFRLGTNGVGITGQLKPLASNPKVPPTLLFGNTNFDPFVGNNEAGLVGTVGITQFLTRTHREATNMLGGTLPTPNGHRLLEPTGLLNNRRMVGYVPPTPEETVFGDPINSVEGIFEIPEGRSIAIAPANSATVGRGNAAYTRNVGGVLIESSAGDITFIPQWTERGYESDPLTLEADEAQRVIYALVPQQAGQNLQLGERYAVTNTGSSYQIADGGFTIISADKHAQNFQQERPEVYAVEDTLPGNNAVTAFFNGIQGVYVEPDGTQRVPTVDADIPAEADARVGNDLFSLDVIPGDPGQTAYSRITRAGGFYIGGALTGGIGNQEDQVRRTTTEMQLQTDELITTRIQNTLLTPLMQMDSIVTERTTITESLGTASFDIDQNGELTNVVFVDSGDQTFEVQEAEVSRVSEILQGEETLVSSEVVSVTAEAINGEFIEGDTTTTEGSDSYANVSSLEGELAIGGVYNFGNTPWSQAANTIRAELFARDSVFGRSGSETGWRAEVLFHPFGEVKRDAFQYDAMGNVVPVYKTEPVLDASGQQVMQMLTGADGEMVEMMVNQFAVDENGDRMAQSVGTGTAKGPGIYVRLEDTFDDNEGVIIAGGLQFAF